MTAQSTIFTIDFEHNPMRMNVFMNFLADKAKYMRSNVKPMIGCYKGKREHSFIIGTDDFNEFIRGTEYMRGQESVLHVASGNKMEATLEYLDGSMSAPPGTRIALGSMHEVCEEEAMQAENWTYRPDMKCYWIAKPGNPDNSLMNSIRLYRDVPAEQMAVAAE